MIPHDLIEQYAAGPGELRTAIAGMSPAEIDAVPIEGKWSTRQVICHLTDFDLLFIERMKRIIAENNPQIFNGDPDVFAEHLLYDRRDLEIELATLDALRRHGANLMRALEPEDFARQGTHSEVGPLTLHTLLERIVNHIPHHVRFIDEKRAALQK